MSYPSYSTRQGNKFGTRMPTNTKGTNTSCVVPVAVKIPIYYASSPEQWQSINIPMTVNGSKVSSSWKPCHVYSDVTPCAFGTDTMPINEYCLPITTRNFDPLLSSALYDSNSYNTYSIRNSHVTVE